MIAPGEAVSSGIQHEIALAAVPADERVWVPQAPDVWFRPPLTVLSSSGTIVHAAARFRSARIERPDRAIEHRKVVDHWPKRTVPCGYWSASLLPPF